MRMKMWAAAVLCVVLLVPAIATAEKPGDVRYNRTKFQFGQQVYFNFGDCMAEEFDKNNYLFPHVYNDRQHIKKGIFVNIEEHRDGDFLYRTATIAYKGRDGKGAVIKRHVIDLLPQQKTIVFNW